MIPPVASRAFFFFFLHSLLFSFRAYSPQTLLGSIYKPMKCWNNSRFPNFFLHFSLHPSVLPLPSAAPDVQHTRSAAQSGPISIKRPTADVESEIRRAHPTSQASTSARKFNISSKSSLPTTAHNRRLLWWRWLCSDGRSRLWTGKPRLMGNGKWQQLRYEAITVQVE